MNTSGNDYDIDDELYIPDSTPFKYDSLDITDTYGIDTSMVDLFIYIFLVILIISAILLYLRANGYSFGNFLKGFHNHMYFVGKDGNKLRNTSVKTVIVPKK